MSALNRSEAGTWIDDPVLRPARPLPPPERRPKRLLLAGLVAADVTTLLGAATLATALYYRGLFEPVFFGGEYVSPGIPVLGIVAVWMAALAARTRYGTSQSWGSGEFSRLVGAIAAGTAMYVLLRFTLHMGMPPRLWLGASWVIATSGLLAERLTIRRMTSQLHARGRLLRRTLVVGTNSEAAGVVDALLGRRFDGFAPVGCLASSLKDKLSLDYTAPVLTTLGSARDVQRVVLEHDIDTVIVVSSAFDPGVLERIIGELSDSDVDVYLSSSLSDVLLSRVSVREVAGIPLISLRGISLSPANLLLKRAFDLALAGTIILLGLPLWVVIAILIKLTSPGPVLYVQERVGLRGKRFGMFKFRSMADGADERLDELRAARKVDAGPMFKLADDPRVTWVGRWLRRFSIDEFPQLLNVVRGEMSLVGPRPPLPSETLYYTDYQWRRLDVVPGMTGLWQVSGRSSLSFEQMVGLDLFYIGNWRLALDLSILARTLPAVLGAKGAW